MNYSKETIQFASDIVLQYIKLNQDNLFEIALNEIPDFIQHEFSAKIMSEKISYSAEATGPDNPYYEKTMLPALKKYLLNTTNKDNEIEFISAWKNGITYYFYNNMQELLNEVFKSNYYKSSAA